MKRISIIIMAVVLTIPAFQSCKKGANDPFLSLASRTGRLVGEWQVSVGTSTSNSAGTVFTQKWDDGTYQESTGGTTVTGSYVYEISIKKDGTYETRESYTMSGTTETYIYKGNWFFLGANKDADYKNKECVGFQVESMSYSDGTTTDTYTYTGLDPTVYAIDELKSKEIIIKYSYSDISGSYTQDSEFTLIPQ